MRPNEVSRLFLSTGKKFLILPAISILYFSCTKKTPSIQPPMINSFMSNPGSINQGDSSTLSWSVDGATYLTINGETVTGSSKIVTPSTSTEYTLVATSSGSSVNAKTAVTVNIPPAQIDTLGNGWEKKPLNYSTDLFDIFFVNNIGFAIGAPGILKSSDGGNTWSLLMIPSSVNTPFNMGMGNETNAIFVGGQGQILSTRDGGISFNISTLPDYIGDVFFVDSITAFAAGTNVWKTTDAGSNWVNLYSFNSGYTSSLYFLNKQIGWALRGEGLYKTVNAGVDWQLIPLQFDNSPGQAIFFLNTDTGYISGGLHGGLQGQYLHRTVDGGVSWTNILTAYGGNYLDIHFVSDRTGYVTDNSHIYKTDDGGNTWTSEVNLASNILIELHFTDADHGWACGTGGTILKYSR